MPFVDLLFAKGSAYLTLLPARVGLDFAAIALVSAVELAVLGWARSSLAVLSARGASARRDLLSFALDATGLRRILGHACTLGLFYYAGLALRHALDLNWVALPASPVAQIVMFLLVKSFADYWSHRAMHRFAPLWEIHKYHHAATEMTMVSAHRQSVLDAPWTAMWLALTIGVFGTPVVTFLAVGFLIEAHELLIHSRLPFYYGKLGERLLVSPSAHRLHHARDERQAGRNFGDILSVWDHLFGTYSSAEEARFVVVGVDDAVYNAQPWHREMLYSVRQTGHAAVRSIMGVMRTARA